MMLTTLSAIAEQNRLEIVELLRTGPLSVNEVASRLHLRQPQASKHLRVLAEAGIVVKHSHAQRRIYSLRGGAFRELEGWIDGFRSLWESRIDTYGEYVQEMKHNPKHVRNKGDSSYDEEEGR